MYSWYIDGLIVKAKVWVGGTHYVTATCRPIAVHITARESGDTTPTVLDINVIKPDGSSRSIFTYNAALPSNQNHKTWTAISPDYIEKGSTLTLDIDSVSYPTPCRDLTVELEVE